MAGSSRAPAGGVAGARARWLHRAGALRRLLLPVLVAVLGAAIGIALTPATRVDVGPVTATVHLRPSIDPRTVILLPPVGEVVFDTHRAPLVIEARVQSVDVRAADHLLYSDEAMRELESTAPDAITSAAIRNAGLNALLASIGAATAVGLTFRRVRRAVVSGGAALAVVAVSCGLVGATFRPQSLYQPQFDGLLSQAAYIADVGQSTAVDYSSYRTVLAEFVGQVSALYVAADSLPVAASPEDVITVLHVSDIHDNPQAYDMIRQLTGQFAVDAVVDTGDIISWGTSWENAQLATIGTLGVPYVFVSGNHDGAATVEAIAAQPNAVVLNNEITEVAGLRIAGIGDPRFAADDDSDAAGGFRDGKRAVAATAFQLGETVSEHDAASPEDPVDLALIHDPTQPEGLEGRVPLVLSGHMHTGKAELDRDGSGTDWMTLGSTGGALASGGVRPVLDGGEPLDLSTRLLHFDASTHRLIAYDDITMGGLGLVSVSIKRHQMPAEEPALEVPEGAVSPSAPLAPDESVSPGQRLPDDQRVTDPAAPGPPVGVVDPAAPAAPAGPPQDAPTG